MMNDWTILRDKPRLRGAVGLAGCAAAACLLATASFNGVSLPLGTALSAALPPIAGIAVLSGSLFAYALTGTLTREPVLICALALATLLRWILGVRQSPRAAALLAAASTLISMLVFGMAGLVRGTGWLIWLGGSVLAGLLAFCVRGVMIRFEAGMPVKLREPDTLPFSVCYVAAVASLCSVRAFAVNFGIITAVATLLTAARRYRITGGVVVGTLSAVALLLAGAEFAGFAAILPAAGFAAGALAGKKSLAMCCAMQAFGGIGLWVSGGGTAAANAWVNSMLACLTFLFLPSVQIAEVFLQWSGEDAGMTALTEARMEFMSHSIAGVRGSAERIANMLAKQEQPAKPAEQVCERVCAQCRSRSVCWERAATETRRCFRRLSGAGVTEELSAPLGCLKPEQITEEFSRTKRQNAITRTLAARLRDSQALLFSQMKITEDLLHRAGTQARRSYDREHTRDVTEILEKYGIPYFAAAVSSAENGRMLVELYVPVDSEPDSDVITECLQEALQRDFSCCGTEIAGDEQRLVFQTEGGYHVETAAAQCAVSEDEPCGDCWDTFSDSDGSVYLAVSDGMGTGRHAAVDAKIVLTNFRQLVQSGMDCKAAARMINAIMLTKSGDERFATLDVAKICTDTAAVTLYKYGAGPTFIKHGERITLCQAATNPIGILPLAEPYTTVLKLDRGDMLFLLTDGLDDALFPYIRQRLSQGGDLQTLAHTVCAKAQRDAQGIPQDDVTVLAAAIG